MKLNLYRRQIRSYVLAHISLKSTGWISIVSVVSLISYLSNAVDHSSIEAKRAFDWTVGLQGLIGSLNTLITWLLLSPRKESRLLKLSSKKDLTSFHYTSLLLIPIIFLLPPLGVPLGFSYLSILAALSTLQGRNIGQLGLYILSSVSFSLQLIFPDFVHSLFFPQISILLSISLIKIRLGKDPNLAVNISTLFHSGSHHYKLMLHSLCLSLCSAFNVLIPLLLMNNREYAYTINLMLRLTFVIEAVLLSKITYQNDINYATYPRGPKYAAAAFTLFFLSTISVPPIISVCDFFNVKSFIASPWMSLPVIINSFNPTIILLVVAAICISLARLFYGFAYYKLGSYYSAISSDNAAEHLSTKNALYCLLFWSSYILLLLFTHNLFFIAFTAALPFLASHIYVHRQLISLKSIRHIPVS